MLDPFAALCVMKWARAVNPMNVEGRIEGGPLQGYSFGMMERIQFGGGIAKNPGLENYMIPAALNPTTSAILNAICGAAGACIRGFPAVPRQSSGTFPETAETRIISKFF